MNKFLENFISDLSFPLKENDFRLLSENVNKYISNDVYSLLSIGTGDGTNEVNLINLLSMIPSKVMLIDQSEQMLKIAKSKISYNNQQVETFQIDFMKNKIIYDIIKNSGKTVITMFGGTLGNVDYKQFLGNLSIKMEDYLFLADVSKHSQDIHFETIAIQNCFNEWAFQRKNNMNFVCKIDHLNSDNGLFGTYNIFSTKNGKLKKIITITTFTKKYLKSVLSNYGLTEIKIIESEYDLAFCFN